MHMSEKDGQKLLARFPGAKIGPTVQQALAKIAEKIAPKKVKFQDRRDDDAYKSNREREYAELLEDKRKSGEILRWAYEPMGLRIDDGTGKTCVYWPDFAVWYATFPESVVPGIVTEFHETKGKGKYAIKPGARTKFLAARRLFPEFRFRMIQMTEDGWEDVL